MSKKKAPAQDNTRVGYGRPPVHSRFRKGQSGNPTGKRRPNEAERAKELMRQELYRLVTVRENDKVTRMPALQAVVRSQINSAAKGNVSAQRAVIKTIQDIEVEPRVRETAINERLNEDANDMSDEQLIAIIKQHKTTK
jgi:Family of unknown function (DUF5681)